MGTSLTPAQDKYYGAIVEKLNRFKGEISGIYLLAKKEKLHSDTVNDYVKNRVLDNKIYKKMPSIYRAEIKGFWYGCEAVFRQNNIEWSLYYDGQYIGNSHRENKEVNAMYANRNLDNTKITGKHVYIGTQTVYF